MGTHPIFESDFDCLTEKRTHLMPDKNKPVVFITGASGFVGRAVLDELSKREVIPIPVYNSARTGSNREIKLDLCDFEKMRSEIDQSGADVLIHCAAKCNVANVSDEKEKGHGCNKIYLFSQFKTRQKITVLKNHCF